jgi:cell division protein FtsA
MFWRKDRHIIAALEVGSSKITVAVGELSENGDLTLLGVGENSSASIRKCEIVDFELAQKCVHDALNNAEMKTDVAIEEVYLAISGAHIRSTNAHLSTVINCEGDEIQGEHLEELREMARQQPLNPGYVLIHDLLQRYVLDDGSVTENPVGLCSKRLSAEYHLISGIATRLQTTIRCVKELSINVRNYALSSYATAQAVLTQEQKNFGAVVINCGAGVTDYIVYQNGAVVYTGVLGVGGDHLTNDIQSGLRLPYIKAEQLKRASGSVWAEETATEEIILLQGSYNFEERQIYKSALVTIMQARQAEMFEIIQEDLVSQPFWADFNGTIYLTGGASRVQGLVPLVESILPCTVELAQETQFNGDQTYASRPDLTTVLGLLQYARYCEMKETQVRGWARMGQSIRKALSSIGLF